MFVFREHFRIDPDKAFPVLMRFMDWTNCHIRAALLQAAAYAAVAPVPDDDTAAGFPGIPLSLNHEWLDRYDVTQHGYIAYLDRALANELPLNIAAELFEAALQSLVALTPPNPLSARQPPADAELAD